MRWELALNSSGVRGSPSIWNYLMSWKDKVPMHFLTEADLYDWYRLKTNLCHLSLFKRVRLRSPRTSIHWPGRRDQVESGCREYSQKELSKLKEEGTFPLSCTHIAAPLFLIMSIVIPLLGKDMANIGSRRNSLVFFILICSQFQNQTTLIRSQSKWNREENWKQKEFLKSKTLDKSDLWCMRS